MRIIVVGGGPAGMMAAIRASQLTQDVTLLEKNPTLGRKLLLSGKGRCNLTNLCNLDSFLKRFSGNGQFLRDAFKKFFSKDLVNFFEARGLKIKVERQARAFPVSDKASSILAVLKRELLRHKVNPVTHKVCNGVKIIYERILKDILMQNNWVKGVVLDNAEVIPADKIILACGGASYKFTGSSGEVFTLLKKLGHKIIPFKPGLVPLETKPVWPLAGLALKNIRLKFSDGQREIISDIGELLFTDFGISGPLVLSLSAEIADWLNEGKGVSVRIDLKPALSEEQLNERLLREFKINSKKSLKNLLKNLLPLSLIAVFLDITKITPDKKVSYITQQERLSIVSLLKGLRLEIVRARPIEEAMVTRGGVSLKEINPRTMESRLIKGLYFAGEMIDVAADTGGFNLQAAFSTGYLAGESAALNLN